MAAERRIVVGLFTFLMVVVGAFLLHYLYLGQSFPSWVALVAFIGISALYWGYQRGWACAAHGLVLYIAILIGTTNQEPFLTQQGTLTILLPPILAAMLLSEGWIVGCTLLSVAILVGRAGWASVYLRPDLIFLLVLLVGGIITGRRMTTHRLSSRDQLLAAQGRMLDVVDQAVFATDATRRIVYWNQAACRLYGWTMEEAIGQPANLLMPPELHEVNSVIEQAVIEAGTWTGDAVVRRKDGQRLPVFATVSIIRDARGPGGVISVATDATARVRETAQREGQRQFFAALATGQPLSQVLALLVQTIETHLDDGLASILRVAPDGQTLLPAFIEHLPEALRQRLAAGVPIQDGAGSCGTAAATRRVTISSDIRTDPLWQDDGPKLVAMGFEAAWSMPILDSGQNLVGSLAIYFRTPRPAAVHEIAYMRSAADLAAIALERRATEEALREREQRYRLIAENSSDLICVLDQQGRYVYASPSYEALLGLPVPELLGQSVLMHTHPDDLPTIGEQFQELWAEGRVQATFRSRHPDGSWRWIESEGRRAFWHGEPVAVIVSRDITTRRELEQQLHQAQKLESIGRLAGGIAHDFNNLLVVVGGNAEFAAATLPKDSPVQGDLAEIRAATERAAHLTRQLLSFARKQVITTRVVDLNEVVRGVTGMLQRLIGADVMIVIQPAPQPCFVRVDTSQIEQVLINLAVNARDAMPQGGTLTIAITLIDEASAADVSLALPVARLSVGDTGHGIAPELLPHIFEPFFTTKPLGKGTGLGLAVCHGIIAQHRGAITCRSAAELGTTFVIDLPATRAQSEPGRRREWAAAPGGSETILLAEDEPEVRSFIARALTRLGYQVLTAADGVEAVEVATAHAGVIDLLLSDLIMPRGGGRQAAEQLRADGRVRAVLFMTGYAADSLQHSGNAADEPLRVIQKPFTREQLAFAVREALDAMLRTSMMTVMQLRREDRL